MKRFSLSLTTLLICCLLPPAEATIEFIYAIKEKLFEQYSNAQPDTPIAWNAGAGASGDSLLTAVSITLPGSSTPLVIDGEDGEFDLETDDLSSQAELDAIFPNGDVSLSITDSGVMQNLGPFSITGDGYPDTPYFINAVELESHDHSQDFELMWNAFSDADEDDRIVFQIYDTNTDEDLDLPFFLPRTATSLVIPGGTFTADNYYEIDIIFANETAGLETPETIIGYLSTTTFTLSTHTSDTALLFYKWQRNQQTGPATVQEDGYFPLAGAIGVSNPVSSASISSPNFFANLDGSGPNSFFLDSDFDTKGAIDATYPTGSYTFFLTENGEFVNYGPYGLPPDAYPTPPLFQNFTGLQNFDATQDQTVSWSSPPAGVTLTDILVIDGVGTQVWSSGTMAPEVTTAQIPADTLVQDVDYRLVVRFWAEQNGSEKPNASLGYMTSTYIDFQTSEGGGGGVGPIEGLDFLYTLKLKNFQQFGNMLPEAPDGWDFTAGVNVDGVTGASISYPGSGGFVALPGEPGSYELDDQIVYDSQTAFNAAFPDGDITLSITSPDETVGPFTITGDAYPNTPHFLNAVALQSHDYQNEDFTLLWNSFDGYVTGDRIVFEMSDDNGENLFFEFLDPALTSFTIPQGTLAQDKFYEIGLLFIRETSEASATADTVIGYASITNVEISTFPQVLEPGEVWLSRGISAEQTDATLPTSGEFSIIAEVSGLGFSSATVITPLPSEVPVPAQNPQFTPGDFELDETFASEAERDAAYPEGSYSVRIVDNGVTTTHGPFDLTGGVLPVIPGITNWNEAQSINPDQDFQLNWNAFSNASDAGFIEGDLRNNADPEDQIEWDSDRTDTGYLIPNNFLQPNSAYTGELIFINPHPDFIEFDSSGVLITAARETFTTFTIQTGEAGGGLDYPTWLSQYFTSGQLLDPDIVGQNADPDGDGFSNYFEFLNRLNPVDSASKLFFSFTENPDATLSVGPIYSGASWEVRSSGDLQNWNTVGVESYQVVGDQIQIDLSAFLPSTFFQVRLWSGGF